MADYERSLTGTDTTPGTAPAVALQHIATDLIRNLVASRPACSHSVLGFRYPARVLIPATNAKRGLMWPSFPLDIAHALARRAWSLVEHMHVFRKNHGEQIVHLQDRLFARCRSLVAASDLRRFIARMCANFAVLGGRSTCCSWMRLPGGCRREISLRRSATVVICRAFSYGSVGSTKNGHAVARSSFCRNKRGDNLCRRLRSFAPLPIASL